MNDSMTGGQESRAGQRDRFWWLSIAFLVVGLGCVIGAAVFFFVALGSGGYSGPKTHAGFGGDALVMALTPQATATATLPPPSEAPIAHLEIPRFSIDAPVQVKSVDANRVMEAPDGPTNVAWYDFTAKVGHGSNAVFSGHVDYINYGAAVFWHLGELESGDLVKVTLDDGSEYQYKVVYRDSVPANPTEDQLRQIVGPTQQDVITLITCGGNWNGHEYDQRVIVRAERYIPPVGAAAPAGAAAQ